MADGCPTVMWVTNAEGGIQLINRAFREFVGASYEEMEGHKKTRCAPHRVNLLSSTVQTHKGEPLTGAARSRPQVAAVTIEILDGAIYSVSRCVAPRTTVSLVSRRPAPQVDKIRL